MKSVVTSFTSRRLLYKGLFVVLLMVCLLSVFEREKAEVKNLKQPSGDIQSYIIRGPDAPSAIKAVMAAGAEPLRPLTIINGVGARLTAAQLAVMEKMPGIDVFADRPLTSASTGGQYSQKAGNSCVRSRVQDRFEEVSFDNQDLSGSALGWVTSWKEEHDDDMPGSGFVKIQEGSLHIFGGRGQRHKFERDLYIEEKFAYLSFKLISNNAMPAGTRLSVKADGALLEEIILGPDMNRVFSYSLAHKANNNNHTLKFDLLDELPTGVELQVDDIKLNQGTENPGAYAANLINARQVHDVGIDGQGVTIAFVDTGVWAGSSAYAYWLA